jgi:UDP-N-acetyl-D-glucosamine dehydrogenase
VDPFYLSWKARKHEFWTRFIELAGEINSAMPEHTVRRLAQCLNLRGKALKGSKILLLGAAYKRNVEDVRESPALAIFELLDRSLAQVSYHDPHVPLFRAKHLNRDIRSVPLEPEEISSADAVLILTDHDAVDYSLVLRHAQLVVDTRNVTARYRDHNNNVMMA